MANILVNKQQWDALSNDEQERIAEGLRSTGALDASDSIVPDEQTAPFDENTKLEPLWNPLKDVCKAACDVAAVSAFGWCTANTAGAALVACLALADAARQECRNRC